MAFAGGLDPSFGSGTGSVQAPLLIGDNGDLLPSYKAVVESDGSVLVDITDESLLNTFGVIHLEADGTRDASFGVSGLANLTFPQGLTSPGFEFNYPQSDLLLQPDGKFILVGYAGSSTSNSDELTLVERFDADGQPDPTFGTGGEVVLDRATVGLSAALLTRAALQSDGKIVLAGASQLQISSAGISTQIASVRLDSDGTPDGSYGVGGVVTISDATAADLGAPFPVSEDAVGVGIQPDGGVVILANFFGYDRPANVPELFRLNADGSRDMSFDRDSFAASGISYFNPNSLIVQPDGKILVLGESNVVANDDPGSVILERFNAGGSLDRAVVFDDPMPSGLASQPNNFALEPDGKVLLTGIVYFPDSAAHPSYIPQTFNAIRLTRDLDFDPSFGVDGVSVIAPPEPLGDSQYPDDYFQTQAVAAGAGGRIFLLGSDSVNAAAQIVIARLINPATPDDFDGDGIADPAVYLPALGAFAISDSSRAAVQLIPFGGPGLGTAIPAAGDYTGSGHEEIGAYLPGLGIYAYRPPTGPDVYLGLGSPGPTLTIPAPGDYYGTGQDDVAVYLANIGAFAIVDPSGKTPGEIIPFGSAGVGASIPAPGDYFGTGHDDLALYLPAAGAFAIADPAGKVPAELVPFGGPGLGTALPMPGDYDGSGRMELAVYLPALGELVYRPAFGGNDVTIPFGGPGVGTVLPMAGDYTGSGKTEPGVYIPALGELGYRPPTGPDVYIKLGIPGAGETVPVTPVVLFASEVIPGSGSGGTVSALSVPNVVVGLDTPGSPGSKKAKLGDVVSWETPALV